MVEGIVMVCKDVGPPDPISNIWIPIIPRPLVNTISERAEQELNAPDPKNNNNNYYYYYFKILLY